MAVDLEMLKCAFFSFDEPVPYQLDKDSAVLIHPITLKESALFLSCCDILKKEKNEINSAEIIQMSYLQFLLEYVLVDEANIRKLAYILKMCLKLETPKINATPDRKKYYIYDEKAGVVITSKQFDDIRRIIMYQNIIDYDDSYMDYDLKKSIEETKRLRMLRIEPPNLERQMAIITAHCGISKKEQLEMTFRSHTLLFNEVCGEVEYMVSKPILLYTGHNDKIDDWIYKKKKGKYDDYFVDVGSIKSKVGNGLVSTN